MLQKALVLMDVVRLVLSNVSLIIARMLDYQSVGQATNGKRALLLMDVVILF